MPIQVLIVDDHAVVREGVRTSLSSSDEVSIVAEATNGAEAIEAAQRDDVEAMVLDLSLPDMSGIDVLKQLAELRPELPVVVFSMFEDQEHAVRALRAGARGYVTKGSDAAEIALALREALAGRRHLSPAVASRLANVVAGDPVPALDELSPREYEVLRLIATGKTLTEIAGDLDLSTKTVSTYRTRLMVKLGVENNVELIRFAIAHDLT